MHTNNKKKIYSRIRPNYNVKYSINCTASKSNFLSVNCNGSNGFLYVNGVKIYQFKANDSETKQSQLCIV